MRYYLISILLLLGISFAAIERDIYSIDDKQYFRLPVDSGIDHGLLLGLDDDDHTIYLLADGTRDLGGTWDLGGFDLTTGGTIEAETIQFDINFSDGTAEGRLQWNSDDGTPEIGLPGGNVNLQIGQEMLVRVKNEESIQIDNGEVVYASSATGVVKYVKLANADTHVNAMKVVGIATEDIAANSFGYITTTGLVRDFDTSAFADGQVVYLDTVDGQITGSAPTAPNTTVAVGIVVYPHATEGVMYARVQPTGYLSEVSDVHITGIANNNVIQWDSVDSRWENTPYMVTTTRVTGSPYAVLATDDEIFVDTDGGAITINLPAGVDGKRYRIINCGSAGNNITLSPNGAELLNGVNADEPVYDSEKFIITYEASEGWW